MQLGDEAVGADDRLVLGQGNEQRAGLKVSMIGSSSQAPPGIEHFGARYPLGWAAAFSRLMLGSEGHDVFL
ncbi:hypothetical protein D3C81_2142910 [compost metagenome]